MEKRSAPVTASTDRFSTVTTAPEPLSKMPVRRLVVRTRPSAGNGPASTMPCSPWTALVGSKLPARPKAEPVGADDHPEGGEHPLGYAGAVLRGQIELGAERIRPARPHAQGVEQAPRSEVHECSVGAPSEPTASRFHCTGVPVPPLR